MYGTSKKIFNQIEYLQQCLDSSLLNDLFIGIIS